MQGERIGGVFGVSGGEDDVDLGVDLLESLGQFETAYSGHPDVEEGQVGRVLFGELQGLGGGVESFDSIVRQTALDGRDQNFQCILFIIDC